MRNSPVVFPRPRQCVPPDGDWQLQAPPGAPGTARQGNTRIIMLVNDGGTATQQRAPGHDRPFTAPSGAAEHGRLSAATRAPGADVPPASTAGAPGQYRLSAAHQAPGHDRPRAALRATRRDRPSAATRAPGADVPCSTTERAPGQHRLRAVANATVARPAGHPRLRQEGLPHTPANPRTLIYPHTHRIYRHSRESGNPLPLSIAPRWRGGRGVRPSTHPTTHQVQPAIQVPPHPRPCSTAARGLHRHHPSRAPPTLARPRHSPSLPGRGPGGRSALLPLSKCWRGGWGVRH